jgi:hypothetical protein
MTYKELIREVQKYLHIQGASSEDLIKGFINESILDFARLDEWEKMKKTEIISLDDSNSYDLNTVLTEPFHGELNLVTEAQDEYLKLAYNLYLTAEDKSEYWSVDGLTLYVTGKDLDVNFQYISLGADYPLTADDDEVPATIYYWDIIKLLTVIKMLNYLGDETTEKEEKNLAIKLDITRKNENRIRKQGKMSFVSRE